MSELNNSGIISVLLDRVSELSERIAPTNSAINSEVRNVFSRNEATSSSSTSTTTRQSQQHGPSSSSQQASLMEDRLPIRRHSSFQAARYFPSARPALRNRSRRGREQPRQPKIDNRPFLRDLILLSGPDVTVVPRQGARLVLMENGHVITGCRFTKDLSAGAVETIIIEAFDGKIPPHVDIELLTSVHASLVVPTLAPGQLLDGIMLHRIFKQKPVYVRPNRQLLNTGNEGQVINNKYDFPMAEV
jgi:hypothetical protein